MATKNGSGVVTMGGIRAWLPMLITIAALLLSVGAFQGTFERYRHQVNVNTTRLNLVETQYTETQVQLATIQRDLLYLRYQVDKLVEMHTEK